MDMTNIVIIGAGPCGLGAAYKLQRSGFENWTILEAAPHPGGLSASFTDTSGFTWDIGGHVMFSHYNTFDTVMDDMLSPENWLSHQRESWIRCFDRFTPYPFQLNIRHLPKPELIQCIHGLIDLLQNPLKNPPTNFEEWIAQSFGEGLAKVFMTPYNKKVWAWPLNQLDTKWVGERVAVVDLKRLLSNIVNNRDDVSWGPNNLFKFPLFGGTGKIWNTMADSLPAEKIRYSVKAVSIDTEKHTLTLSDGSTLQFDTLLSTMPLNLLLNMSGMTQQARSSSELKYSSTHVIGIGMTGHPPTELKEKCWMYFPEDCAPFYRVTHFSHYSHNNVPKPGQQWSLMAEISESPYKPQTHDPEENIRQTVQGLLKTGLIQNTDSICSTWHKRVEYGYPTPTLGRDPIVFDALDSLSKHDIHSRGRFGAWRYEVANMDHSFMQGYEWADCLINGNKEMTLYHPEVVNDSKYKLKA